MQVRKLRPDDWPEVAGIYEEGIRSGDATFETEVPSWEAWDAARVPEHRLVVTLDGVVVGWAALSPFSDRRCYAGVAENMPESPTIIAVPCAGSLRPSARAGRAFGFTRGFGVEGAARDCGAV